MIGEAPALRWLLAVAALLALLLLLPGTFDDPFAGVPRICAAH